jgi:hypothetical protein
MGSAPAAMASQALPLLKELVWEHIDNDELDIVDGFAGAQPTLLCAAYRAVVKYAAAGSATGCGPLSRLRDFAVSRLGGQGRRIRHGCRAAGGAGAAATPRGRDAPPICSVEPRPGVCGTHPPQPAVASTQVCFEPTFYAGPTTFE